MHAAPRRWPNPPTPLTECRKRAQPIEPIHRQMKRRQMRCGATVVSASRRSRQIPRLRTMQSEEQCNSNPLQSQVSQGRVESAVSKSDDVQINPRRTPAPRHDTALAIPTPPFARNLFHHRHDHDRTGPRVTLRRAWRVSRRRWHGARLPKEPWFLGCPGRGAWRYW